MAFSASSSSSGSPPSSPARLFSAVAAAAAVRARRRPKASTDVAAVAALLDDDAPPAASTAPTLEPPERASRYIGKLVAAAAERAEERELALDRRLAKDANPDEERFVTAAYQASLAGEPVAPRFPRARGGRVNRRVRRPDADDVTGRTGEELNPDATAEAPAAKRRRSRFGPSADGGGPPVKSAEGGVDCGASVTEKKVLRGLRQNDEAAIAAYRERYFARVAARRAQAR